MTEHADLWHSFTSADEFPAKSAVLERHCADVGRDPAGIERSAAVHGAPAGGDLIANAENLVSLGVTLLTVGCDGPDYELAAAEALCKWRDAR